MRFTLAAAAVLVAPILSVVAEDHLITVGAQGLLAFSPPNITAAEGDTVTFQFQSKNHSVTQSTFGNPCQIQTTPAQGIDSGFQFVAPNSTQIPEWSFTVNNASSPLWFFCAQVGHCQKGMVFAVNAKEDSDKNFAAYQALAMNGAAATGASSAVSGAISSAVSGAISSATDAAGNAASSVLSAAEGAVTGAAGDVTSAVGGAVDGLTSAIGAGLAGLTGGDSSPTDSADGSKPSNGAGALRTGSLSVLGAIAVAAFLL